MTLLWKTLMTGLLVIAGLSALAPSADSADRMRASKPKKDDDETTRSKFGVVGTTATLDNVTLLTRLLIVSGLNDVLREGGPYTIFAPSDEAFSKLGKETLTELFKPENKAKLVDILKYHVVAGHLLSKNLSGESQPKTVLGKTLTVVANDRGVAINDATVIKADILARNGVIHIIDKVLTPGQDGVLDVARKGHFEKLLAAAQAAGLTEALAGDGPFTIFAPTNEAFEKLGARKLKSLLQPENKATLAEILKYHVVPAKVTARQAVSLGEAKTLQGGKVEVKIADGRLEIGGAKVLATDINASNGIIHVIDTVLIPPTK